MSHKCCSADAIHFDLFRKCIHQLNDIVSFIVNESWTSGMFPDHMKTAFIRPSLKKQNVDSDVLGNYRPISNLSYISKIIKKCVDMQIVKYIDENNLFATYQSGYQKMHSCETAVTK